jgi:hypothetical protein
MIPIIPVGLLVVLLVHLYMLNLNIMDPTRLLRRRFARQLTKGPPIDGDAVTSISTPPVMGYEREENMRGVGTRRQQQQPSRTDRHRVATRSHNNPTTTKLRLLPASTE